MPGGRPSDYIPFYAEEAFRLCLLGLTDVELIKFFECDQQTFYNWQKKHPEFIEAIREGREKADAKVAHALYQKASGWVDGDGKQLPPDSTAMIFWMKNRHRKRWRDKWPEEEEKKQDFDANVLMQLLANAQQQLAQMKSELDELRASKKDGN